MTYAEATCSNSPQLQYRFAIVHCSMLINKSQAGLNSLRKGGRYKTETDETRYDH